MALLCMDCCFFVCLFLAGDIVESGVCRFYLIGWLCFLLLRLYLDFWWFDSQYDGFLLGFFWKVWLSLEERFLKVVYD